MADQPYKKIRREQVTLKILLKNGWAWLDRDWKLANLLVEDDKIAAIGPDAGQTADKVIDAAGK